MKYRIWNSSPLTKCSKQFPGLSRVISHAALVFPHNLSLPSVRKIVGCKYCGNALKDHFVEGGDGTGLVEAKFGQVGVGISQKSAGGLFAFLLVILTLVGI